MTRPEAWELLRSLTDSESLLRHMRVVELVMEALARHYGEDEEEFAVTGILHDADYQKFPDQHPEIISNKLEELGEYKIAHAIRGHYTKWNVPRTNLLDKCIVAADELSGFIYAAALIRPPRIEGMKPKSVKKKFKTKTFAASVDREEVLKGADLIGWEFDVLIQFIIDVLTENKDELGIASTL